MRPKTFYRTIKGKIIAITLGTTLLITLITVGVCFYVFQSLLRKNQIQSVEFSLQVVANNVSSDMQDILYFVRWCGFSQDILQYLETFQDKEPLAVISKDNKSLRSVALEAHERLKEEYHNTRSSRYITRILLSNTSSSNYLQVTPTSGDSSYNVASLTQTSLFQSLLKSPDLQWGGIVNDPFVQGFKEAPILPIVRPIHSSFGTDVIGWVYLSVSASVITDYLKSFPLPKDSCLYLSIGDHCYQLLGTTCQPVSSPFTVVSAESVEGIDFRTQVQKVRTAEGSNETLSTLPLGQEGWYIHQILSRQQLIRQRQVYLMLIGAICVVILSLGLSMVVSLNRTINQPVAQIRRKINEIAQGDFSRDDSIEWNHELGEIGRGINDLSYHVVNLMERRIDDEKQKKDLEYQILQSQINPHFLYNTLNSIKWMATIQGASGIAEMTTALARLLKRVAKGNSSLIPFKEELDLVKDYFLIQQYRYGGSISIDYRIQSEDLYPCMIHRFSLQPIVENALFHGIEPKGSVGKIVIEAHLNETEKGQDLQISITDNGVGMTEETIQGIFDQKEPKTSADFFRHVGISNVNQRIQHDYGPRYGISIASEPGVYTTMTILIPCIREGGKDEEPS